MRGIGMAVKALVGSLGLPPWVVGVFFMLVLFAIFSQLKKGVPAARGRGLIVRAAVADVRQRPVLEKQALDIVWDDPGGLYAVAQECLRREARGTAEKAIARLKELGAMPDHARSLEEQLTGRRSMNLGAELVAIRNMIENGLYDMARARLARAREAFPEEEALTELAAQLPAQGSANDQG
jgi:hypothetical protein